MTAQHQARRRQRPGYAFPGAVSESKCQGQAGDIPASRARSAGIALFVPRPGHWADCQSGGMPDPGTIVHPRPLASAIDDDNRSHFVPGRPWSARAVTSGARPTPEESRRAALPSPVVVPPGSSSGSAVPAGQYPARRTSRPGCALGGPRSAGTGFRKNRRTPG